MKPLLLVTAAALSISTGALADETLKFRGVYQATSLQSMDVGDVDGHSMTIAHITGLVSMPDGSIAQSYFTAFLNSRLQGRHCCYRRHRALCRCEG
jgi:hypothetical protein